MPNRRLFAELDLHIFPFHLPFLSIMKKKYKNTPSKICQTDKTKEEGKRKKRKKKNCCVPGIIAGSSEDRPISCVFNIFRTNQNWSLSIWSARLKASTRECSIFVHMPAFFFVDVHWAVASLLLTSTSLIPIWTFQIYRRHKEQDYYYYSICLFENMYKNEQLDSR